MNNKDIAQMLDLSCVRADSTLSEIDDAVELARRYGVFAIFVLPAHMPYLIERIGDAPILPAATVGFPSGGASTAVKVAEVREQAALGCREFDMVGNIAWLKAGRDDLYRKDIEAVIAAADGLPVKVILECHYLTEEEIIRGSEIVAQSGAAYVKSSTGWALTGATVENVTLMKQTVGTRCKVKAAGGVSDRQTLLALYEAGASRFGIGVRTGELILADTPAGDGETAGY